MAKITVRKPITLGDPDYFINKSWTLSFNFDIKAWVSFHSYLPNWYIAENNFFYSGMNDCCSDFDFIAAELPSNIDCELWGYAFEGGAQPDCELDGSATDITPTTSTTSSTTITTTSSTTIYPCELEGIAIIQEPEPTSSTTSSTTECVRPDGLELIYFITGYTLGEITIDSTTDRETACDVMTYLATTPSPDIVINTIVGEATGTTIGTHIYMYNATKDCECLPDGWYFTSETAYYRYVFHVENCLVTEYYECDATTSSTSTSTTTEYVYDCELEGEADQITTTTTSTTIECYLEVVLVSPTTTTSTTTVEPTTSTTTEEPTTSTTTTEEPTTTSTTSSSSTTTTSTTHCPIGAYLVDVECETTTSTTTPEPTTSTTSSSTTEEPTTTTTTTIVIPPFINSGTRIYIYFDSSGSMDQTLQPLVDMRNGNLKVALLPYYDNDEALYDEMVQVVSDSTERTLHMLNWLAADMPDGNVIVLVFQDEASSVYHTTDIEPRTAQFNSDLSALRTRLDLFTETEYRGVVFQVATPSSNNVEFFQPFLLAVKDGTGVYAGTNGLSDVPNINVVCNVASGITYASNPNYYLNLILGALNENIEFCTLDLNSDPFVFNVSVTASQSITLPFTSTGYYNATVDYGDGSGVLPITAYNDANATHIYASAGDYDISIRGYTHGFSVNNNVSFKGIVNEVKAWGDLRIRKLDFYGCSNLSLLPSESLPSTLVDLSYFARGTSISSIYKYTFRDCINVSTFIGALRECVNLSSIPVELFQENILATVFTEVFSGCTGVTSIPEGLFDNNVLAISFRDAFLGCSEITNSPEGLFRNNVLCTTFAQVFRNCAKMQHNKYIFFSEGEEGTRFLNKSVSFLYSFSRTSFTGIQGEAPELWNCDFGTGTLVKTSCFAGVGNNSTSLSNYDDIPGDWK